MRKFLTHISHINDGGVYSQKITVFKSYVVMQLQNKMSPNVNKKNNNMSNMTPYTENDVIHTDHY